MKSGIRKSFIAGVIMLVFWHCTPMKTVHIDTLAPASVTFPSYVNTLLLLDRSKNEFFRENDFFSGKTDEDRQALQTAMSTMNTTLQQSPRFKVLMATEVVKGNSRKNAFPDPLSWPEIQDLCNEYHCEAVLSFEVLRSSYSISEGERKVKRSFKDEKGNMVEREVKEFYATGYGTVKMGVRIYDPKGMTIIDQQLFTNSNSWEGKGDSHRDAFERLMQKPEATRYLASKMAGNYAYRIAPMPVVLTREFYAKAKKVPQMEQGAKQTEVNDWKNAVATWETALHDNTPPKEAGQLCYDIAVGYEVLGDLESAKKWASRGYVQYNNKKALDYKNMLDTRESNQLKVDEQMK